MNHPNQAPPSHAYIGVFQGQCLEVILDYGSCQTAERVADVIANGGWVQRLPAADAAHCLGKGINTPNLSLQHNLPACEAAARSVA